MRGGVSIHSMRWIAVFSALLVGLVGGLSVAGAQAQGTTAGHRMLYVTFSMGFHGSRYGLRVRGTTDLPNRTMLFVTVESQAYVNLPPRQPIHGQWYHESRLFVHNGHFHTHALRYRGRPFAHHKKFRAEVVVPFPGVQVPSVEAVMGSRGQYLYGPLVHYDRGLDEHEIKPPPVWTTIP